MIVDVGAQALTYEDHIYAPLLRAGIDYRIIGFEPLRDRLRERLDAEGDDRLTLLPSFVGDGTRRTFHVNNVDATSSLFPLNQALTADFAGICDLRLDHIEEVRTERLDDLLSHTPQVDFLKLDIQGFELPALEGADQVLSRTNVVHSEVEFAEVYETQPLFDDLDRHMRSRGFRLIDVVRQYRGAYREAPEISSDDFLLWGEAVYFRRLAADDTRGRMVQALVADLVYGKPGLARHLAWS